MVGGIQRMTRTANQSRFSVADRLLACARRRVARAVAGQSDPRAVHNQNRKCASLMRGTLRRMLVVEYCGQLRTEKKNEARHIAPGKHRHDCPNGTVNLVVVKVV